MKNYLTILGSMVIGAVIMFWFTQTEVQADSRPEPFVCSKLGKAFIKNTGFTYIESLPVKSVEVEETDKYLIMHCRAGKLDCGMVGSSISCVHTGGLFK